MAKFIALTHITLFDKLLLLGLGSNSLGTQILQATVVHFDYKFIPVKKAAISIQQQSKQAFLPYKLTIRDFIMKSLTEIGYEPIGLHQNGANTHTRCITFNHKALGEIW
jgi:hypothetical protein